MSHTPDPERPPVEHRSAAEEEHPEVFHDRDAGQVSPGNRPPEPAVVSGLRKGCLWAIVFTAVLLLIIAATWQWAWDEASPKLPDPAEPDRPGVEAGSPDVMDDQIIGDDPEESDGD